MRQTQDGYRRADQGRLEDKDRQRLDCDTSANANVNVRVALLLKKLQLQSPLSDILLGTFN